MRWFLKIAYILVITFANKSYGQEPPYTLTFNNETNSSVTYLLEEVKYWRKKKSDSALFLATKALHLSRLYGDEQAIAKSLLALGVVEFDKNDFKKSKNYFQEAITHLNYPTLTQGSILLELYSNLAGVYSCLGNNDSAIYYQYLCLTHLNNLKIKDSIMLMIAYNNLSIILFNAEQDEQALSYIKKSLNLSQQLEDIDILEKNYRNIGTYFLRSGQKQALQNNPKHLSDHMDSARKYYNLTLLINKTEGASNKIQVTYYQIAVTWLVQENLKQAKIYIDSAYHASPDNFSKSSELQKGYGDYYFTSKQYNSSIPYYEKAQAINIQQGINNNNWNLEIYKILAICYEMTRNGHLAYEYQRKYSNLREELYNEEKARMINNLELKYRTSEKDKELANQKIVLLQKENNIRSKNFWIIGIIICGVSLTLFLLYFYRNRQKLNNEKFERIKRQQELNHLHAVMQAEEEERGRIARDLHDGIGVLLSATMMNYTVLGRNPHIPLAETITYMEGMELLQEMRKEIRGIAHNLMPGTITQQNLAEAIQNLSNRLQQNNTIKIEVEIYGIPIFLQPERSLSIYRMMEEMIQNVIKHAEATKIMIQLLFHEQQLNIVVQDNGSGFDTDAPYDGIGLQNLRSRTAKLNGEITIISTKGKGTLVELEVPFG